MKFCIDCGKDISLRHKRTKYCFECRRKHRSLNTMKWRKSPSGKLSTKKALEKYQHSEHGKKKRKEYLESEAAKILRAKRGKTEQSKICQKKYRQSPKGIISVRKTLNHCRRNLGFNMLNDYFHDSVAHHINNQDVVFVPRKLHVACYSYKNTNLHRQKVLNYFGSLENMILGIRKKAGESVDTK